MTKSSQTGTKRLDTTLKVSGMACEHCKKSIETAIKKLPGIVMAEADVQQGSVRIVYDSSKSGLEDIVKVVEDVGYDVETKIGEIK